MQDRPTYDELLALVERFLDEEIVPNVEGSRGFHARVAANAVRIVRRELEHEDEQLASEWAGLEDLLGPADRPARREALRDALRAWNTELSERIRGGEADDGPYREQVIAHVRRGVRHKLHVSDPGLLDRDEATQ
jgi:hypothetical protein